MQVEEICNFFSLKIRKSVKTKIKNSSLISIVLKKLKRDKQIRFSRGILGDAIDQRSTRAQKKSRKMRTEIHSSIFIEN